jgi:metallophosphoesterase superfamily enzyme
VKELFYTDPHHGMTLNAHTTPASRKALQEAISTTVRDFLTNPDIIEGHSMVICGGDFFHKHQNPEQVLLDSAEAFARTDKILEGNHDVSNVKGAVSSLQLMQSLTHRSDGKVIKASYNQPTVEFFERGEKMYWAIPHHATQGAFDEAIKLAVQGAEARKARYNILILHCNYNNNFATDETSLNLLRQTASELLETFTTILIGHEHTFLTDFADRVIVLGCPHPTNFGDISDKFVLSIGDNCEMELIPTWKQHRAFQIDWKDAEELPNIVDFIHYDFIRLTGEVEPGEVPQLARIIKQLWKSTSAFAIRSDVKILAPDRAGGPAAEGSTWNVQEVIEQELRDTDLSGLWRELLELLEESK